MSLVDALPRIGVTVILILAMLWIAMEPEDKHKWILKWREIKSKLKI